jgi:hypothetical protein
LPFPLAVNPGIPAVAEAVQLKVVPFTADVKLATVEVAPLQMVCAKGTVTVGTGFTIISKCTGGPLQPLAVGVITYTTESIVVPPFTIVCAGMLPLPLAAKPDKLPPLLAVQLKVVPAVVELNVMAVLVPALHMVCGATAFTFGNGLAVIVSLAAIPTQPPAVGVITYTTIPGDVLGLVRVCEGMEEVAPLAVNPVMPFGLEPVQLKVAPATFDESEMPVVAVPLHMVWNAGNTTCGIGFTVMS